MGLVRPSSPDGTTGPAPVEIRVFAHRRVALRYHALAFVPLPGDDANLHRPGYVRAWRLRMTDDGDALDGLEALVEAARLQLAPTRPPADDALGRLESFLAPSHARAWEEALEAVEACRLSFGQGLQRRRRLFTALQLAGLERLDVHLCPSLRAAGRAVRGGATYAVAVPLPDDEASSVDSFLQLVHECCHPLADDVIAPFLPAVAGDTARGSAGHAAHALREDAALAAGRHWMRGDPKEETCYLDWVARYRPAERLAERLDAALDLPQAARAPLLARAAEIARAIGGTAAHCT